MCACARLNRPRHTALHRRNGPRDDQTVVGHVPAVPVGRTREEPFARALTLYFFPYRRPVRRQTPALLLLLYGRVRGGDLARISCAMDAVSFRNRDYQKVFPTMSPITSPRAHMGQIVSCTVRTPLRDAHDHPPRDRHTVCGAPRTVTVYIYIARVAFFRFFLINLVHVRIPLNGHTTKQRF